MAAAIAATEDGEAAGDGLGAAARAVGSEGCTGGATAPFA